MSKTKTASFAKCIGAVAVRAWVLVCHSQLRHELRLSKSKQKGGDEPPGLIFYDLCFTKGLVVIGATDRYHPGVTRDTSAIKMMKHTAKFYGLLCLLRVEKRI